MSEHKCPPVCHRCPELGGDLMPGCYGVAIFNSIDYCTCHVERTVALDDMREQLRSLARRVARLERARDQQLLAISTRLTELDRRISGLAP